MIDELATRASLTVAAFLLLGTGMSVLGLMHTDAVREAAEDLASHLERQLESVSEIDGEAVFPSSDPAFRLPATLAGNEYVVIFRGDAVEVIARFARAARALGAPIHPFAPSEDAYSTDELAALDSRLLEVRPRDPFVVERAWRLVDSERACLTFVHLPR
ncbi:MAG TPA: hypothetical protein VGR51_05275 [Thermoplasmata archaeon]|jgi:hypothetical protein|nr:hypothetical protein [Thermoplasmata archaeon]